MRIKFWASRWPISRGKLGHKKLSKVPHRMLLTKDKLLLAVVGVFELVFRYQIEIGGSLNGCARIWVIPLLGGDVRIKISSKHLINGPESSYWV